MRPPARAAAGAARRRRCSALCGDRPASRRPARRAAARLRRHRGLARGGIEAAAGDAVAVKINVAFFEALGVDGWAALERVRRAVPDELICILDAKRGDIGSTASATRPASSVGSRPMPSSCSQFLGEDAIAPSSSTLTGSSTCSRGRRTHRPRGSRTCGCPASPSTSTWRDGSPTRGRAAASASLPARPRRTSLRDCVRRCRGRDSGARCRGAGRRSRGRRARMPRRLGARGGLDLARIARASRGSDRARLPPRQGRSGTEWRMRCYTRWPAPFSDSSRRRKTRCRFPDRWSSSCCW